MTFSNNPLCGSNSLLYGSNNSSRGGNSLICGAIFSLLAVGALALPDDTEQPIHIVTDEAIRDETTGVTLYRGDVRLRQGTIRIAADEIRLGEAGSGPFSARDGDPFFKIVATGQPARLQQLITADGDITFARANVVEYLRARSLIRMQDDAQVEQGATRMRGGVFEYLIEQQQIRARADAQQRVRSVIPPEWLGLDSDPDRS